jgi:hypothetical protein
MELVAGLHPSIQAFRQESQGLFTLTWLEKADYPAGWTKCKTANQSIKNSFHFKHTRDS